MNATQTLERAAINAHRQGKSWAQFWQQHADSRLAFCLAMVRRAERVIGGRGLGQSLNETLARFDACETLAPNSNGFQDYAGNPLSRPSRHGIGVNPVSCVSIRQMFRGLTKAKQLFICVVYHKHFVGLGTFVVFLFDVFRHFDAKVGGGVDCDRLFS